MANSSFQVFETRFHLVLSTMRELLPINTGSTGPELIVFPK